MRGLVGNKPDLIDWAAAGVFAVTAIWLGLWGIWMMASLVMLPLGLATFIGGVLAWYAGKGVFSREREAWWVSLLLTLLSLGFFVPVDLLAIRFGRVPSNEYLATTLLSGFLFAYIVLRRDRYGIGRRLPASMTLGYEAEKAK